MAETHRREQSAKKSLEAHMSFYSRQGYPLAFMLIDEGHMEALFVDPARRGIGIGAALVQHGLTLHPKMTTDVNEQNDQAIRFYERMGFKQTGRSPIDGQGRPYPLIHLEYLN